jgi:chromate transporter
MAAYSHFDSMMMGALGLLGTTFYTFLPCFLFVFAGAPIIERTHGQRFLQGFLSLVTAVVLGAIADLLLFLGKGLLFPDGQIRHVDLPSLAWVLVSLVLLKRIKLKDMYLVFLSIGFGLARHWAA